MNLYEVQAAGKPVRYLLSEDAGTAMEQVIINIKEGNRVGQLKLIAELPPETETALAGMDERQLYDALKQLADQHKANARLYRVCVDGFVVCPWVEAGSENEAIEKVKAKGMAWSAKQIPQEMAAKIIAAIDEAFENGSALPFGASGLIDSERNAAPDTNHP